MGFLGKLFSSGEPQYPLLDAGSAAAKAMEKFSPQLEALMNKIKDSYEAVPAENALYVFLGKPPGMFGIAWFLEGDAEEHNLKKLITKKGLSQRKIDNLMQKLRDAYSAMENEQRFIVQLSGRKVIVTPSDKFAGNLYNILHFMDES